MILRFSVLVGCLKIVVSIPLQASLLHYNNVYSVYDLHFQHAYVIKRATNFLEDKLKEGISDNYTLALVTYALSWAKSTKAKEALSMLNERAERQGIAQQSSMVVQMDFFQFYIYIYIYRIREKDNPSSKLKYVLSLLDNTLGTSNKALIHNKAKPFCLNFCVLDGRTMMLSKRMICQFSHVMCTCKVSLIRQLKLTISEWF